MNANGSSENKGGIYRIVCTASGNCYVGSARNFNARWRAHKSGLKRGKHHSVALLRAWNKYGEIAFRFEILEVIENEELLTGQEQMWMDRLLPAYNTVLVANGSARGRKLSPSTRAKMSASKRGVPFSEEQRKARSERMKGISWGGNRPGVAKSEAARKKMSEARKGIPLTAEHKAKLSEAKKGKPWSQARRDAQERKRHEQH